MYKELIIIFIILILGLILYSFLANHRNIEKFTLNNDNHNDDDNLVRHILSNNDLSSQTGVYKSNNFDNYNHFTGSSSILSPGSYYEPNGGVMKVTTNNDGSLKLQETLPDNAFTNTYTNSSNPNTGNSISSSSDTTYYGSNGGTANIISQSNGQQAIQVVNENGITTTYSQSPSSSYDNITSTQYYGSTGKTIPSNYNTAYTNGSNSSNSSSANKTTFLGPNGATAVVNSNTSITLTENGSTTNFTSQTSSPNIFTNSNGETFTLTKQGTGIVLILTEANGTTQTFTNSFFSGSASSTPFTVSLNATNSSSSSSPSSSSNNTTFFGPNGATAVINSNTSITVTENGNTTNFTSQTSSPTFFTNSNGETLSLTKQGTGMVLVLTETNGSTQTFTNPFFSGSASSTPFTISSNATNYNPFSNSNSNSNNYYGSNTNNSYGLGLLSGSGSGTNAYDSVLPSGIPRSQIPPGSENLYILKSEVIPPVCPACPSTTVCPSKKEKPPPCPPCARCPEPKFTCKKIPNYGASDYSAAYYGSSGGYDPDLDSETFSNNKRLPIPILNSFSTFGM